MSIEYGDGRYLQPVKTFHELAVPPDPGRGFDMQCPDICSMFLTVPSPTACLAPPVTPLPNA